MKWITDFIRGQRERKIEHLRQLQAQLRDIEEELHDLERKQELQTLYAERAQAKLEIEKFIHSLKPDATEVDFIPPFSVWWELQGETENLDDDLEQYVTEFHLVTKDDPKELDSAATARAKLKALEDCNLQFKGSGQKELESYKMTLWALTMWLGKK